jgi:hypothetical protein
MALMAVARFLLIKFLLAGGAHDRPEGETLPGSFAE